MIYALLTAVALASILFLIGCIRVSGRADDTSEQIARQLAEQGWPHLPKDGSRGLLK